jgi:pyruvate/2-oxoglutarate dehydrogenase complex dihydrolipoamide acyltransferase (E2) component
MIEGKKMPTNFVIRAANKKTVKEISNEIRAAQKVDLNQGAKGKRNNLYLKLPLWIRHLFWARLMRDPFVHKKFSGTVGLTAIGMFAKGNVAWAIPITPHTLTFTLGGIYEKPVMIDGKVEGREVLCVTMSIDHDLIDGGPSTRFFVRLGELIASGYGLE